jgi:hypothetical protein
MISLAAHLSALVLGLLAGAMLLVAATLFPYWRSLPPADFRLWFAAHSGRIGAVMLPLGAAAVVIATGALVLARSTPARGWLAAAAAGAIGVAAVTLLVNEPANHLFAGAALLTDAETRALLARWGRWHVVRLVLGTGGFVAALRAVAALGRSP